MRPTPSGPFRFETTAPRSCALLQKGWLQRKRGGGGGFFFFFFFSGASFSHHRRRLMLDLRMSHPVSAELPHDLCTHASQIDACVPRPSGGGLSRRGRRRR